MKKSTKNKVYQRLSTWKIVTLFLVMTFLGMQSATAQYTAIPDANFEHALFTLGIDTIDGDHQVLTSAVSGVTSLDVSLSGISDLTGIQEFTSLQTLYCYNNLLTSLNLSGLTNLQILQCGGNQLSSLNVSGLNSLSYLDCDTNQLPSLNVSGLTNLQNLDCRYNQLASLNLSGLTNNFMFLSCSYNQLTNINVSGYINLETIYCNNNQLTSLNASGLTNLNYLYCGANQLTSLNLTGSRYLESFDCISNPNLTCISVFDSTMLLIFSPYNPPIWSLVILPCSASFNPRSIDSLSSFGSTSSLSFAHLTIAACLAIILRLSGVRDLARAIPPFEAPTLANALACLLKSEISFNSSSESLMSKASFSSVTTLSRLSIALRSFALYPFTINTL